MTAKPFAPILLLLPYYFARRLVRIGVNKATLPHPRPGNQH